jgi:hypothetical protein
MSDLEDYVPDAPAAAAPSKAAASAPKRFSAKQIEALEEAFDASANPSASAITALAGAFRAFRERSRRFCVPAAQRSRFRGLLTVWRLMGSCALIGARLARCRHAALTRLHRSGHQGRRDAHPRLVWPQARGHEGASRATRNTAVVRTGRPSPTARCAVIAPDLPAARCAAAQKATDEATAAAERKRKAEEAAVAEAEAERASKLLKKMQTSTDTGFLRAELLKARRSV